MRLCTGEAVDVYEAVGETFSDVMGQVAFQASELENDTENEGAWYNVTVQYYDGEYTATLYVH